MNRIDEIDALRDQDWSKVYAEVPDAVNEGVQMAFARIHAYERRRKFTLRALACAACLAVVIGTGSLVLGGKEAAAPDRVAAPVAEVRVLAPDELVWAAPEDAYFHIYAGCPQAQGEHVELQLVTAREFEKEICRTCGANVQLPE